MYVALFLSLEFRSFNAEIKSFESMFHNVYILKEITIKYKKCKVQNFRQMFHFCTRLESINFLLDDVCPTEMYSMFGECISLKSIYSMCVF